MFTFHDSVVPRAAILFLNIFLDWISWVNYRIYPKKYGNKLYFKFIFLSDSEVRMFLYVIVYKILDPGPMTLKKNSPCCRLFSWLLSPQNVWYRSIYYETSEKNSIFIITWAVEPPSFFAKLGKTSVSG